MPTFVLDTDILTLSQHGHATVLAHLAAHAGDVVGPSAVSIEEQMDGWRAMLRRATTPAAEATASRFLVGLVRSWAQFPVFPLTPAAITRADQLVRARLNVRRNDLRIGAVALELAATVVTRNRRDFARIPGLLIEDWSV
jgi:tRNA(fMet)-specific endonuclease VapC